ncbi:MAG: WD40 repeat domain-containing protein [Chloroflexi bacterium]|nr:WD40 repeat domain-containing protein [Chloroflexota bacterium]
MRRRIIVLWFVLLCSVLPVQAQEDPVISAPVDSRTGTAYSLEWSPNGDVLAVGSGYEIMIYPADLGAPLLVIEAGEIVNITWSADGTRLVSAGGYRNPEIRLWAWDSDTNTLTPAAALDGNDPALGADLRSRNQYVVAWSSQDLLASMADDRIMRVQVWDPLAAEFKSGFEVLYTFPLRELVWNANGTALIGAGQRPNEESFVLISMDLEGNVTELLDLPEDTAAFTLSPDQTQIALIANGGLVTILDLVSGDNVLSFQSGVTEPVGLSWHPDGDRLALLNYKVEDNDNALEIWDISAINEDSF